MKVVLALAVCAAASIAAPAVAAPGQILSTTVCLFDADPLCQLPDWNDDGRVSAADLPGSLRFMPVAGDEIRVVETAAAVMLRSAVASARLDKTSATVALGDAGGAGLTAALPPRLKFGATTQVLNGIGEVQRLARGFSASAGAGATAVQWTVEFQSPRTLRSRLRPADSTGLTRVSSAVAAAAGERFYGLTERIVDSRGASELSPLAVGALDRRGEIVKMEVVPTMSLYTPFFHSSRGYGVFVEGTMTGVYDLAKSDPNAVSLDFEFNPRTGEHGVVYFIGDYDTILDEYTALTGRPFLPPRWGFLHLRWRDEHRLAEPARLDGVDMNADFVNDLTMYETLGIPAGNYEFDRPWTDGYTDRGYEGFSSFRFDPVRFPNSEKMLAALQNRGYHILVFGAPWALGENAVAAEQLGYYAPRTRILIDYTNPAAAAWWSGAVQSLIDLGISGLKLDRSEFAETEIGDAVPSLATDVFFDGRNGRELFNGYTIEYARVHHDAFKERLGRDFMHYFRAGYAGSQQYGIFWGGDTPGRTVFGAGPPTDLGLRSAILSLARVAFMGFPIWGTDTGGYYQFGDRDVLARWLEFSAFCPLMEIGGGNQGGGQHAPWDMPTEPAYDQEMIDIYRYFVTLHHELVPLFYSLAHAAADSGRPLVRPLVFDFPGDPAVADLWDEFMLGDLLFAPLWRIGERSRQVYLPAGTWIDYWQPRRRITGPATLTAEAALDRIPLYVRAGGLVPLAVSSAVTGNGSKELSEGRLTLDTYPLGTSTLILREDEGESTFTLSDAGCDAGRCVQLDINGRPRGYIVRMLAEAVGAVMLDDQPLVRADSLAALAVAESGWFFDAYAGRLWVKFATAGADARLRAEAE
ncbi:MAG: glycoside hydrolase family 31 protein [Deltaproteobacteria bacterium]|nr:glycoside hydrolase family 31 protein [Deltaproteobacteria bacterium]